MKNLLNGNAGMILGSSYHVTNAWFPFTNINHDILVDVVGEELVMVPKQECWEIDYYFDQDGNVVQEQYLYCGFFPTPEAAQEYCEEEDVRRWKDFYHNDFPRPTFSHDSQKIWCF